MYVLTNNYNNKNIGKSVLKLRKELHNIKNDWLLAFKNDWNGW